MYLLHKISYRTKTSLSANTSPPLNTTPPTPKYSFFVPKKMRPHRRTLDRGSERNSVELGYASATNTSDRLTGPIDQQKLQHDLPKKHDNRPPPPHYPVTQPRFDNGSSRKRPTEIRSSSYCGVNTMTHTDDRTVANEDNPILFIKGLEVDIFMTWIPQYESFMMKNESFTSFSLSREYTGRLFHNIYLESTSSSSSKKRGKFNYISNPTQPTQSKTQSIGVIEQPKEVTNMLNKIAIKIHEANRETNQILLLEVTLHSFNNPYPFPVGIRMGQNEFLHTEYTADRGYMFILQPNGSHFSTPKSHDLRRYLDYSDVQLGVSFTKKQAEGQYVIDTNDVYVYEGTPLHTIITSQKYPHEPTEVSVGSKKANAVRIDRDLLGKVLSSVEHTCGLKKFVGYEDFTFGIYPIGVTSNDIMKDKDKFIPHRVTAQITFNYI